MRSKPQRADAGERSGASRDRASARRSCGMFCDSFMSIRQSVVEHVDLLSRPSAQLEYEARVPIASIHGELVSGFCDDLYHPKSQPFLDAFTASELKELAHLYGLLVESVRLPTGSVGELLNQPQWRRVVEFSKDLAVTLGGHR